MSANINLSFTKAKSKMFKEKTCQRGDLDSISVESITNSNINEDKLSMEMSQDDEKSINEPYIGCSFGVENKNNGMEMFMMENSSKSKNSQNHLDVQKTSAMFENMNQSKKIEVDHVDHILDSSDEKGQNFINDLLNDQESSNDEY